MNLLLLNASAGRARRVREGGRDYLVAPLTSIVPGVLSGSKGPLYYPEDEVSRNVGDWDGMPLTVYHPFDPATGAHLSASEPGVVERQGVGEVRKSTYNGKLRHEGWFDAERTRAVDPRVYQSLVSGKPMELSTGLYTDNEVAPQGSHHNGRPYGHVARNYRPDHIAVLPDQQGACSVMDGCGVMVNGINTNADGFASDEQRTSFFGLKESGKLGKDSGNGGEHPTGGVEVGAKTSQLQAGVGYSKLKDAGNRQHADNYLKEVERWKGGTGLRSIAVDHGVSTQVNPGGKGTDLASPIEIRKRLLDKHFPTSNSTAENAVPQSTLEKFIGWLVGNAPSAGHPQVRGVGGKFGNGPDLEALKRAVDASAQGKGPDGKGGPPLGPEDMEEGEEDDVKARHGGGDEKSKAILAPDDGKGTKNMAGNMIPQGGTAPVAAPEPDARAASKDAAVASMGTDHDPAHDHAMKAMDFSRSGKPGLAAGRHDKAAEAHDDAATGSRKAGDETGAQDHEHAAMLHRKASSMQSLAVRNAKKQQDKAQDGDDNEPDNDEDDMAGNTAQKTADKFDRTETIEHLTTNCPCWKGGSDVLNLMSDRQLASVAQNAKAEGSNADTTGKGGSVQAGGEEDEDDHETADDHVSEDLFTDKVKVRKEKMSENRFLNLLPPSYREAVVNAQEITRRERVRLVNRLITNVSGDAARKRIGARLMQKPLAELRDMLAMVPEPAYNERQNDGDGVPLYNGAGYGADDDTRNRGVSDEDVLPLPVTNFAEISKEQRRQRQQA